MTMQPSDSEVEVTAAILSRLDIGVDEQFTNPAINRLPVEILCDIFLLVLASEKDFTRDGIHIHSYSPPMGISSAPNVAHVCRAWRTIALNTPWLWNFLRMSIMQTALDSVIPLPVELLEKSKTLPVFLRVNFNPAISEIYVESSTDHSNAGLNDNTSFLHRIKGVDIDCGGADYQQIKPWLQQVPITHLTLLDITFIDPPDPVEDLFDRLTHLHLRCCTSLDADVFINPDHDPWENLVSLTIECETPELDLAALEVNFPKLEELFVITENAFAIYSGGRPPPPAAEPFKQESLRVLGIYSPEPAFQSILFERMAFPNLRAVGVTAEAPEDTRCVQTLLDRSGCPLERVSVISTDGKDFGERCRVEWELFGEKRGIRSLELVNRWTKMSPFRDSKDRWYTYRL